MGVEWLSPVVDALTFGYNIFGNERNYTTKRSDTAWEREQYLENRDYNRALQQQIFEREDTAIQRAVQDAGKAGLSPLSVAGGNGAGAGAIVGATQAPTSQQATFNQLSPIDLMGFMRSMQEMAIAQDANERAEKEVNAAIAFQNASLALEREKFGMDFALKNAEMFNNLQMSDKRLKQEADLANARLSWDKSRFDTESKLANSRLDWEKSRFETESKLASSRLDWEKSKFNRERQDWTRQFTREGKWRNEDIKRFEKQFSWTKSQDIADNMFTLGDLILKVLTMNSSAAGRFLPK